MSDHPLYECAKDASLLIDAGCTIHQKFTCMACGARQTIEEPNRFFTHGNCEECGHTTDIRLAGCNYMVIGQSLDQILSPLSKANGLKGDKP